MSQLTRDLKPYLSSLRLSKTRLIVFVEGTDFDPLFYGAILHRFGRETSESYEIRRASELPSNAERGKGGSGGQLTLTCAAGLWERYKTKHVPNWKNKKALAFCIDKDSVDFTGLPDFNQDIIRTPLHSVENHLFASTNLERAVEIALSLAPTEAENLVGESADWCLSAASLWREWVLFCLLCLRLNVKGFTTYKSVSIFNNPNHQLADKDAANAHFLRLQAASGLDAVAFTQLRDDLGTFIDELIEARQHDRMFKGKWYLDILFSQLTVSRFAHLAVSCGKNGLSVALRSQFQLRGQDYRYYEETFLKLLSQLPVLSVPPSARATMVI